MTNLINHSSSQLSKILQTLVYCKSVNKSTIETKTTQAIMLAEQLDHVCRKQFRYPDHNINPREYMRNIRTPYNIHECSTSTIQITLFNVAKVCINSMSDTDSWQKYKQSYQELLGCIHDLRFYALYTVQAVELETKY